MKIYLIGLGCGTEATMTMEAKMALLQADCIIGADRLLRGLSHTYTQHRLEATRPQAVVDLLLKQSGTVCVVYSGDSGFYSGSKGLLSLLEGMGYEVHLLPGISSVQYFAAKLKKDWQDWQLVSAHGVVCDAVSAVMSGKSTFFLTGGAHTVPSLCQQLFDAGLGELKVWVGEDLSYPDEQITALTVEQAKGKTFASLSVLLVEAIAKPLCRTSGLPDTLFCRGDVPMTKQEVRSVLLAKLGVQKQDVCWDIGAGTGSVSVELALQAKQVWAIERNPAACQLILENRKRFSAWNLHLIQDKAPQGLPDLPKPDVVFIGGSGGSLIPILQTVQHRSPQARVAVTAIALETLSEAHEALLQLGYQTEVTQLAVSRTQQAGKLHLLMAQNPTFLIVGKPQ